MPICISRDLFLPTILLPSKFVKQKVCLLSKVDYYGLGFKGGFYIERNEKWKGGIHLPCNWIKRCSCCHFGKLVTFQSLETKLACPVLHGQLNIRNILAKKNQFCLQKMNESIKPFRCWFCRFAWFLIAYITQYANNNVCVWTGCFRWKPEVFPGGSADNDTVLNLSREHTSTSACDLSITSVSLPASSSVSSSQPTSFEPAPTVSKSQCPVSKSNFSILNLTKDCVKHTSSVIKQENESDPLPPDTAETIAQEVECSPERPASRDSCCVENTQDSVASAADSEHTKGVEGSG